MFNSKQMFAAAAVATLGLSHATQAQLYVYEPFDYGATGADQVTNPADPNYNLLHLQPDGVGGDNNATGLGGVWTDIAGPGVATDLFLSPGNLPYLDLPGTGNHVRGDTNQNEDNFGRAITAGLDGGSELWFAFVANKLQNNFSAAEEGIVIGNQQVSSAQVQTDDGSSGLQGFAISPTTAGNNWSYYAWDGTQQIAGDDSFGVATNGSETNLLVGKVEFNAGAGGADIFSAFVYDVSAGSVTDDENNLIAIGSPIEADVDESALDFLSVTRRVNTAYDEIRIGGTFADVIGGEGTPSLPGDTDGDGDVDDADLGTSFSNYTGPLAPGTGGKTAATGDNDGDGDVDDADLGTSFSNYTGPLAAAAVPEPTSLALLGLGGLLIARRRRA